MKFCEISLQHSLLQAVGSYGQKCRKRGIFKCHIYVWTLNIFENIARKLATRSLTYNHCGFRGSRNSQRDPCVMCAVHGECSANLNNFKTLEARPPRLPSDGKAILKEYGRYTAAELEDLTRQQKKTEREENIKKSKKKSQKSKTEKKKPKKKSKKSKTNKRRSKNRKKNRRNRRRSSSRRS